MICKIRSILFGCTLLLFIFNPLLCSVEANKFPQSPPKNTWKIIRDTSTNTCAAVDIAGSHPGFTETLGEYPTKEKATAALEKFKKTPDPKKSGYEMCM